MKTLSLCLFYPAILHFFPLPFHLTMGDAPPPAATPKSMSWLLTLQRVTMPIAANNLTGNNCFGSYPDRWTSTNSNLSRVASMKLTTIPRWMPFLSAISSLATSLMVTPYPAPAAAPAEAPALNFVLDGHKYCTTADGSIPLP
jgi:hypothetical protein